VFSDDRVGNYAAPDHLPDSAINMS